MIDTMGDGEPGLVRTGRWIIELELDRVLDDGLNRERYPDLRRVDVRLLVHNGEEVEFCKREVGKGEAMQWFPALESRGLLTVGVDAVQEP